MHTGKLASALAHHADLDGKCVAMSDNRRVLSRSELAAWVAGAAADLDSTSETIGIFGENSVEWAVAFLAASVAGKTIVPVPTFFSKEQRNHLIRDAGIDRIVVPDAKDLKDHTHPSPLHPLSQCRDAAPPFQARDGG
jgi:long-chain acyl-CoA synthetase